MKPGFLKNTATTLILQGGITKAFREDDTLPPESFY